MLHAISFSLNKLALSAVSACMHSGGSCKLKHEMISNLCLGTEVDHREAHRLKESEECTAWHEAKTVKLESHS